jgi:hypothetical protein
MERTKAILGNLWFQVGAFCAVTASVVIIRILSRPPDDFIAISPFFAILDVKVNAYGLLPPFVFAVIFFALPLYFKPGTFGKLVFLTAAFVSLAVAVNSVDGGLTKIYSIAVSEYYHDAVKLYGKGNFLHDYHLNVRGMKGHTTVHPPGVFVYLYPLVKLFGPNWRLISVVNVVIGGVGGFVAWKTTSEIFDRKTADYAALLYITTPSLLLYAARLDIVFVVLGSLFAYSMVMYFVRGGLTYAFLAGLFLAIGFFFTYEMVFFALLIAVWAIMFSVTRPSFNSKPEKNYPENANCVSSGRREISIKIKKSVLVLAVVAAVFVSFFGALYALFGFDAVTVFKEQQRTTERWWSSGWNIFYWVKLNFMGGEPYVGRHRSYLLWVPGNLLAFGFLLGPPTAVIFLRNLWRNLKGNEGAVFGWFFVLAFSISFLLFDISGLTLGETERVWAFMVPFFVIGAGRYLAAKNPHLLYPVLATNLVLAWGYETFFFM